MNGSFLDERLDEIMLLDFIDLSCLAHRNSGCIPLLQGVRKGSETNKTRCASNLKQTVTAVRLSDFSEFTYENQIACHYRWCSGAFNRSVEDSVVETMDVIVRLKVRKKINGFSACICKKIKFHYY